MRVFTLPLYHGQDAIAHECLTGVQLVQMQSLFCQRPVVLQLGVGWRFMPFEKGLNSVIRK